MLLTKQADGVYKSEIYTTQKSDLGVDTSMYFSKYLYSLINALDELKAQHPKLAEFKRAYPTDFQITYRKGFFINDQFWALFEVNEEKAAIDISLVHSETQFAHSKMQVVFRDSNDEDCRQFSLPSHSFIHRDYTVVFTMLDVSGEMSLVKILDLLGEARELYGIQVLPNFVEGVFQQKFLLKSHSLNMAIHAPLMFGTEFAVYVSCLEADYASFLIKFEFVDLKTKQVKVSGRQKIAYCNLSSHPTGLPEQWREAMLNKR